MNSGKVQLDVIIKGKDEVAAMLANIEKQAKQTEKQLANVGSVDLAPKSTGIAAVGNALGNTVEVVDKAEERFNKLVGAIGFVGAAFAILPAIYDFTKGLFDTKTASELAQESLAKLSEMLIKAKKDFEDFNKERLVTEGARKALEIEEKIVKASDAGAEIARERIELDSQLATLSEKVAAKETRLSEMQAFVELYRKRGEYSRDVMNTEVEIRHVEFALKGEKLEVYNVQKQVNDAKAAEQKYAEEILQLEKDKTDAIKSQLKELREVLKESKILYLLSGGVFGSKIEKKPPGAAPSKPKPTDFEIQMDPWSKAIGRKFGISREEWTQRRIDLRIETEAVLAKRNQQIDKDFVEYVKRTWEAISKKLKPINVGDALQASFERATSTIRELAERELQDSIDAFAKISSPIERAVQQMDRFAESTSKAFDAFSEFANTEKFKDIIKGLSGVQDAMGRYQAEMTAIGEKLASDQITFAAAVTQGESAKSKAIISGSTEGLAAIGKLVGGLKAEYALRSAGELAMGFATLANPVESAGHFVAAGLFAVAAGKAASGGGGKGASAAGGDGEAPASSSSLGYGDGGGGQRTVVYNFSTLLADRQQVHRAIRDSELVGQRNGYGRRRGV